MMGCGQQVHVVVPMGIRANVEVLRHGSLLVVRGG